MKHKRLRSVNYRHWICAVLLALSGALTWFRYRYSVLRTGQAFRDLGLSIRFYFVYLFTDRKMPVTVNDLPQFELEQFVSFSVSGGRSGSFSGSWSALSAPSAAGSGRSSPSSPPRRGAMLFYSFGRSTSMP